MLKSNQTNPWKPRLAGLVGCCLLTFLIVPVQDSPQAEAVKQTDVTPSLHPPSADPVPGQEPSWEPCFTSTPTAPPAPLSNEATPAHHPFAGQAPLIGLKIGDRFSIAPTRETRFDAVVTTSDSRSANGSIKDVIGSIEGVDFGRVIMSFRDDRMIASVFAGKHGSYEILQTADDHYQVTHFTEHNTHGCELHDCDFETEADELTDSDGLAESDGDGPVYETNCVHDIIVFFNEQARQSLGGNPANTNDQTAIRLKIDNAIAAANMAYADSGIPLSLRLLSVEWIDYHVSTTASLSGPLGELTSSSDGIIDQVHDKRNTYGADYVSLWVRSDAFGGRANVISSPLNQNAFSIIRAKNPLETFVHELGHNQGCRHLPENYNVPSTSSWFPDSYAHHFTTGAGDDYVTVVASTGDATAKSATRILRFSSPVGFYEGTATGLTNLSDTVRTLSLNRGHFEAFRPYAPGSIRIQNQSSNSLEIVGAYPERDYAVYRRANLTSTNSLYTGITVSTDTNGAASVALPAPDLNSLNAAGYWFELEPQ